MSVDENTRPLTIIIEKKSWKFYSGILLGLTVASAGISLFALNHRHQSNLQNKRSTQEDMYEMMTDELISLMNAEQRSIASNTLKTKGNAAFSAKSYKDAIMHYTQALKFKADPVLYSNRAACYASINQYEQVILDCNESLSLNPIYTKSLIRRAQAFEKRGELSSALYDFGAVCFLENFKNDTAHKSMKRLLKIVSEQEVDRLLKIKPHRLPSPAYIATYLKSFRTNDFKNIDIPPITNVNPGDAYIKNIQSAIDSNNYDQLLDYCQKAISLGCSVKLKPMIFDIAGTLLFLEGQSEAALNNFNQAIALNPNYTKAIQKDPNNPDIYFHRGQLYFSLGKYELATKDYASSVRLDPNHIISHVQLAVIQYKLGEPSLCKDMFQKTITQFPLSSEVFNYYGEVLSDMGDTNEAINMLDQSIMLNPGNPLPYIHKARIFYSSMNNSEEAKDLCKLALEADPACDAAIASLSQILIEQNKAKEALVYYEKAVDFARAGAELDKAVLVVEAIKLQIRFENEYKRSGVSILGKF